MLGRNGQRGLHRIIVTIVAIIGISGLLGWKFYEAVTTKTSRDSLASRSDKTDLQLGELSELSDLKTIQENAIAGREGISVVQLALRESDGVLIYEIVLSDGTSLTYDAKTGTKLKTETKVESEKSDGNLRTNFATGIGFAKALEIAKANMPDSKAEKIELKLEDGHLVYSVRFSDKARVDVDSEAGRVVRTKAPKTKDADSKNKKHSNSKADDNRNKGDSKRSSSGSNGSDNREDKGENNQNNSGSDKD